MRVRVYSRRLEWILVLLFALTGACDDASRDAIYESNLNLSDPIAIAHGAVQLDRQREKLYLFHANSSDVDVQIIPTSKDPQSIYVTPDRASIALLNGGDQSLDLIQVDSGEVKHYALQNSFDAISFSNTSLALTYYSSLSNRAGDELFNPNSYAIIDFSKNPKEEGAIILRSLRGFGERASNVYFVPPFELAEGQAQAQYALFTFPSYITFADLRDENYEVTVPLNLSPSDPKLFPMRVLFSQNDTQSLQDMFVYILTAASDDIYVIQLLPGERIDGEVKLMPSIGQLSSGYGPRDMIQFKDAEGKAKLLVVNAISQDVALIDPTTASVLRIPLEASGNRIFYYESQEGVPYAMIYQEGGGENLVSFINLAELEARKGQAIHALALESSVEYLLASPVPNQVIVVHAGGSGLSMIDLSQEYSNALRASNLDQVILDQSGERLFTRMANSPKINVVNLQTGQASHITLDDPIAHLIYLPEVQSLLAFHEDALGSVTAIGLDNSGTLKRQNAVYYQGYVLDHVFDR